MSEMRRKLAIKQAITDRIRYNLPNSLKELIPPASKRDFIINILTSHNGDVVLTASLFSSLNRALVMKTVTYVIP